MTDEELQAMSNAELDAAIAEGRKWQDMIWEAYNKLEEEIKLMKNYKLREAKAFEDMSYSIWDRLEIEKSRRRQVLWDASMEVEHGQ